MARPYALLTFVWAVVIFVFSTQPETAPSWEIFPHQDKAFHFAAYALLAFLIHRVFLHSSDRDLIRRAAPLAAVMAICYGTAIEFYQYFLPAREASVADFLANCGGVATLALYMRGRHE